MTPEQTDRVLAELAAAWPRFDLTQATCLTWYEYLEAVPAEAATVAVRRAITEDRWFPTIARFLELARAAQRAIDHKAAAERGLPEPSLTPAERDSGRAFLGAIRAALGAK